MKLLIALTMMMFAVCSFSADKYWTGATDAKASKPGNWCDDAELTTVSTSAPVSGDNVYLTTGANAMTWDINDVVLASWTQDGYTGTVTFSTGKKNGMNVTLFGYTEDADGETRMLKVSSHITVNTGTWTINKHTSFDSTGMKKEAYTKGLGYYRLIIDCDGDIVIGDSATLTAKGLGFVPGSKDGQGPGAGMYNKSCGSHGGMGAYTSSPASCYGIISRPVTIGSSGPSGNGGGAITLISRGKVTVDGVIDVSGSDKSSSCHVSAGGSILIVAASLSGGETGKLNANGGAGGKGYDQGGGGGRIGVILTGDNADFFQDFQGIIKAKNGKKSSNSKYDGGGGTIYVEHKADGEGKGVLIIDGCEGGFSTYLPRPGATVLTDSIFDVTPKKIIMRAEAKLNFDLSYRYILPTIVQETDSTYKQSGYVTCAANREIVLTDSVPAPLAFNNAGSSFSIGENGDGTYIIGSSQKLYVNEACTIKGSVIVASNGAITHYSGTSSKMNLTITGDLEVQEGGTISANELSSSEVGSITTNCGGSYGGCAKSASHCCYGSIRYPLSFGSKGRGNTGCGKGGGLVRLTTLGKLTVNGKISSNGGSVDYRAGSGGSVYLTAASICGSGGITANGGNSSVNHSSSFPGGGGRIAIYLTGSGEDFSEFNVDNITAYGGRYRTTSSNAGGAGTVYLKTGDQADDEGICIVRNLYTGNYTDFITGSVTDLDVGKVYIDNAKLFVSNTTLKVRRGWNKTASASLECKSNSEIKLVGECDAVIQGANEFYSISCEVPGKKIYFGTSESDVFSVCAGGSINFMGSEENPIELLSYTEGEDWRINMPMSLLSASTLKYLLVDRSDASAGEEIITADSSEKTVGSCKNWRFTSIVYGAENTWTGEANLQWNDPSNWSLKRAPVETDRVIISAGGNSPELSSDISVLELTVEEGATLKLNGNNLTVAENFKIDGALECSNSERITVVGAIISMAANSFVPARSTLVICGEAAQSIDLNGTYFDIAVEKSGGSITWSGSSEVLRKISFVATTPYAVAFTGNSYIKTNLFEANGSNGELANLTLSGAWQLEAKTSAYATGALIGGCDVSKGVSLYVKSPYSDLGSNNNCVFIENSFVWTGVAGDGKFSTAENWQGGIAPDETGIVEIPSGASVTISGETKVAALYVGGEDAASTLTVRSSLEVDSVFYVGAKATVVLDVPMTVNGNALIEGGTITHTQGGTSEAYKINLAVAGNLFIEKGSKVIADGKGYSADNGISAGMANTGASHGGCGSITGDLDKLQDCYGSYVAPVTYGSGGYTYGSGGGAIKLVAGGILKNDGTISANGTTGGNWYSPAGGSIWIKCADLTGVGSISAVGGMGQNDNQDGLLGGGGRIAIEKTTSGDFSNFLGEVTARGGCYTADQNTTRKPNGSAGHVTWISPGSNPKVVVDNNGTDAKNCYGIQLPVSSSGDSAKVIKTLDIVLRNSGSLYLTGDARIHDLSLETSNAKLYLNGHKLTILSLKHKDRNDWKGSVITGTGGTIEWISGFAITVR